MEEYVFKIHSDAEVASQSVLDNMWFELDAPYPRKVKPKTKKDKRKKKIAKMSRKRNNKR